MYQKIFKNSFLRKLMADVKSGQNLNLYSNDLFPDLSCIPHSPEKNLMRNTAIKGGENAFNIKLMMPEGKDYYDFENACIIHRELKLTVTQATDVRLWAYLSHIQFWNYMRKRFPVGKGDDTEKQKRYILDHWFVNGLNPRNLSRHGISLLWWGAHLTYSNERGYDLTKEFFSMLDYTRTIMPGSLGRSENFRLALLEFVVDNKQEVFSQYRENKIRVLMRKLNYLAGYRMLASLEKEGIKSLLLGYKEELKQVKGGR